MPTTHTQPTDPHDGPTHDGDTHDGDTHTHEGEVTVTDPATDDLREKFRAALDRKLGKGSGAATDTATGSGGSKASARTSNTKHQREFRRKSGG